MATISDVARLSGLSVSTVSRVINNKPHVSEAKKQKVLEAMEALGYSPLQAARQMRGSGSGNIAVVVPTITNNFFAQLVDSIERTCGKYGYRTLIIQTYGENSGEEDALNLLKMQHADGAILCAIENSWDFIKSYTKYGKIVACNEYNDDREISMICAKQYEGFKKAAEYLLLKGHKRIAYCTGAKALVLQPEGLNIDSDRYRGFIDALSTGRIAADPAEMLTRIHTMEDGRRAMRQLLSRSERPDAVIAGSDEVAAGMVIEGMAAGIRIPEDMAVMGVDDQLLASCIQIPLTTIRQPVQEEGELAAKEMIRQLRDGREDAIRKELALELVIRQSA